MKKRFVTLASLGSLLVGGAAFAQTVEEEAEDVAQETEELGAAIAEETETFFETRSIAVSVGGGVNTFTSEDMRDTTSAGGLWEVSVVVGADSRLGVQASYIGEYHDIDSALGDDNATLLGTTFEAAARYNFMPGETWTPYAMAGIGWRHYEVLEADWTTSDTGFNDSDDVLVIPLAAGLNYKFSEQWMADARLVFRPSFGAGLLAEDPLGPSPGYEALHTLAVTARLGYMF